MNLIDILDKKLIVEEEDDDDDEHERSWQKRGEIAKKLAAAITQECQPFFKPNVGTVDEWLYGGGGEKQVQIALLTAFAEFHGWVSEDGDEEKLVKFFKDLGLSRGEAMFVLDQA